MKKSKAYHLSSIIYLLGLTSLVSAGPVEGVRQLLSGLGQVIMILIQFISNMILDINSFDEFLFAKLIFFILIFLVIYTIIHKNELFGDNKPINRVITAAISILAVRFIPDELVGILFLQYGALGAGMGITIPFFLILFFLHQSEWGPMPRKIGWVLYGFSYMIIFYYSMENLQGIANIIYWTGILGIIIAFFFDSQIHAAFGTAEFRTANRNFEVTRLAKFRRELRDVVRELGTVGLTTTERRVLEKQEKFIKKQISKILKKL